jgi:nitroreductase
MEKPATTSLDIHPVIKNRWSPRSFSDKMVSTEQLNRIFEAARWAPSSFNEQPWRFILGIKGDDTWDKLHDCLVEFNQIWAGNAPVLALAIGKKTSAKGGENSVYQYDVGQSMAYITLQAEAEGLKSHQMGGFSKTKARELFDIPEDFQPMVMSAIGYQDRPEQLQPDFAEMEKQPRERKPIEELVFTGSFK